MSAARGIDHGTVCGCVSHDGQPKRLYADRQSARAVRRRKMRGKGPHMGIYRCPEGAPGFHIGRLAPAVVAGIVTRSDRYGS